MGLRDYYQKWESSKETEVSYSFFDLFNQNDWDEFWEDYLSGASHHFVRIFDLPKQERLDEYIIPFLSNLSVNAQKFIANSLNDKLNRAIKTNDLRAISKILGIVNYLEYEVPFDLLAVVINNPELSEDTIIDAVLILNQLNVTKNIWEKIDIKKRKFLLPFFMMFFQDIEPYKSLEKLTIYKSLPANISEFEIPVKNSLISLLKYPSDLKKFRILLLSTPKWIKEYIDEILNTYSDLKLVKTRLLEEENNLVKIKLGLSVYPDFVLVDLFKKWGLFKSKGIDITIEYYPWNKLFSKLDNFDADIIITNYKVYKNMNESITNQPYKSLMRLNRYEGFAVVSNDLSDFTYESIKNEDIGYNEDALQKTLNQIKGKRIFASKDTDHQIQLIQTIIKSGLNHKDFKILHHNREPYDGFKNFLKGNYDVFVGAAIHTQALKKEFKVILSEKTEDFGAVQYNLFVSNETNDKLTKECQNKFESAIKLGLDTFDTGNIEHIAELHKLFDSKIEEKYRDIYDDLTMTLNEFGEIIKEIMRFNLNEFKELEEKDEKMDIILKQLNDQKKQLGDQSKQLDDLNSKMNEGNKTIKEQKVAIEGLLEFLRNEELKAFILTQPKLSSNYQNLAKFDSSLN